MIKERSPLFTIELWCNGMNSLSSWKTPSWCTLTTHTFAVDTRHSHDVWFMTDKPRDLTLMYVKVARWCWRMKTSTRFFTEREHRDPLNVNIPIQRHRSYIFGTILLRKSCNVHFVLFKTQVYLHSRSIRLLYYLLSLASRRQVCLSRGV